MGWQNPRKVKKVYNKDRQWDKEGIHIEMGNWLHMCGMMSQKAENVPPCLLEISIYKAIKQMKDKRTSRQYGGVGR